MEEIVKHINDTNSSYRAVNAGDAKNTDLFLDNEHYELFKDSGEQITVRYNKENLTKAILFIASILPRKYDNSSVHRTVAFSTAFVYDQLAFLDGFFTVEGDKVETRTQVWNARKDVLKKNGKIDSRFYFNGLLEDVSYTNFSGENKVGKFTIRNYVAGSYSDLHIKKASDGIFDVWITNTQTPYDDGKDIQYEIIDDQLLPLQQIFYGAPGTGKSHIIKEQTKGEEVIRTTFHPDTDYSTFVGAYKPTTEYAPVLAIIGDKAVETGRKEKRISYEFVSQAFLQAYVGAWKKVADADGDAPKKQFLVIEEINRGNCAQIFGDLFQLLDRNDYGFSDYSIKADADMQKQLKRLFEGVVIDNAESINALYDGRNIVKEIMDGEVLLLPSNLYIWATMNTSDQSLFPIDSAFKRRWDWQYMPINDGGKKWKIEADTQMYSWWSFIKKINDEIYAKTNSEDKKLGYYFCKPTNGIVKVKTFVSKVLFYLWNDVFKDFDEDNGLFAESYDKFFDTDSKGKVFVVKEKVQAILDSLKVEVVGDIDESEGAAETSELTQLRSKDKFMLNGEGRFGKSRIALEALKKYASANPSASASDIVAAWAIIGIANLIETSETHAEREERSSDNRMADKWNELHLANGEYIYLSNQFPNDKIYTFITAVNSQPWGIRIEKIAE